MMERLIEKIQGPSDLRGFALPDLGYRVYVRDAADLAVVREVIDSRVGGASAVYVLADVCRSDLLVEIEGQGIR